MQKAGKQELTVAQFSYLSEVNLQLQTQRAWHLNGQMSLMSANKPCLHSLPSLAVESEFDDEDGKKTLWRSWGSSYKGRKLRGRGCDFGNLGF